MASHQFIMLKKLLIFLVPLLFIASCQKDIPRYEEQPEKYDISLTKIDSTIWYPHSAGSPKKVRIDIDMDGVRDFQTILDGLTYSTDFGFVIKHSFVEVARISSIGTSFSFAIFKDSTSKELFSLNDLNQENTQWKPSPNIFFLATRIPYLRYNARKSFRSF